MVTTVCDQRRPLLITATAARIVCDAFRGSDRRGRTVSLAWVVMPNHIHWVFSRIDCRLEDIVGRFKCWTAYAINRREKAIGRRVWQPGFYDRRMRTIKEMQTMAGYVVENPQRAGLVADWRTYPYLWLADLM